MNGKMARRGAVTSTSSTTRMCTTGNGGIHGRGVARGILGFRTLGSLKMATGVQQQCNLKSRRGSPGDFDCDNCWKKLNLIPLQERHHLPPLIIIGM